MHSPSTHTLIDLYGCSSEALVNGEQCLRAVESACASAGLLVIDRAMKRFPNGAFTCVLLLSESHVAIHTWPERSLCCADIFVCAGDKTLITKCLACVFRPSHTEEETVTRGNNTPLFPAGWIRVGIDDDYFESFRTTSQLVSVASPYQTIDIFESPTYGRVLVLDGDIQLTTSDEQLYHSLLVLPAIWASPSAKSVLVLGGGDGGALRQVVNHARFERIHIVERDSAVLDLARHHLPGVSANAFEDPRVRVFIDDAFTILGTDRYDLIINDLTRSPSGIDYESTVRKRLTESLSTFGLYASHTGWHQSNHLRSRDQHLDFTPQIACNAWIQSFAALWSFTLSWNDDRDPSNVLHSIEYNSHHASGAHRALREYFLANALVRPMRTVLTTGAFL